MSKYEHECAGCGCTINTRKQTYMFQRSAIITDSGRITDEHYFCSKCMGEDKEEIETDVEKWKNHPKISPHGATSD